MCTILKEAILVWTLSKESPVRLADMPILDSEETREVVESWEIVRQNPEENGLRFFQ